MRSPEALTGECGEEFVIPGVTVMCHHPLGHKGHHWNQLTGLMWSPYSDNATFFSGAPSKNALTRAVVVQAIGKRAKQMGQKVQCWAPHFYKKCDLDAGHQGWHVAFNTDYMGEKSLGECPYEVTWCLDTPFDYVANTFSASLAHMYSEEEVIKRASDPKVVKLLEVYNQMAQQEVYQELKKIALKFTTPIPVDIQVGEKWEVDTNVLIAKAKSFPVIESDYSGLELKIMKLELKIMKNYHTMKKVEEKCNSKPADCLVCEHEEKKQAKSINFASTYGSGLEKY
jgi:hypothetical protein